MSDNWEDLLNSETVEIKKVEDSDPTKGRFHDDEDVHDPNEVQIEKEKEAPKNESPPKVFRIPKHPKINFFFI